MLCSVHGVSAATHIIRRHSVCGRLRTSANCQLHQGLANPFLLASGYSQGGCTGSFAARLGEDRTERLDIIPATARVIITIRPKYACANKKGGILQAPAPVHLIEGGLPTEGTLAHVATSKKP